MNEKYVPPQEIRLTPSAVSHKLDAGSTMDQGQNEQPPKPNTFQEDSPSLRQDPPQPRPENLEDMLREIFPGVTPDRLQAAHREAMTEVWKTYSGELGRPLTSDEKRMKAEFIPPPIGDEATESLTAQGIKENPEDYESRRRIFEKRYGERYANIDVLNQLGDGEEEPPENPPPSDHGGGRRNNNAGSFSDLVSQALTAREAGPMANSFLESLVDQAIKRANAKEVELIRRSGDETDERSRARISAEIDRNREEYEIAMRNINRVYREANPGRQQQERDIYRQEASTFVGMVREAAEANRGKMSETSLPSSLVKYIEEDVDMGDTQHIAIGKWLTDIESREEVMSLMTDTTRKIIFEQLWEKFVGRADNFPESSHYREALSSLQAQNAKEDLSVASEKGWGPRSEFVLYLRELEHARSNMHDLNASFRVGDEYKKAVVQQLNAEGLHFVQNDLAGVNDAILLWEKFAGAKVAERHQWLSWGDIKDIEDNVASTMQAMGEQHLLKKDGRELTDWEIKRALKLSKITLAGTQRMAMYAGFGNIPAEGQGRIGSIPYEYVARAIFNFKMIALRFFSEKAQVVYMNKIFKEMTKKDGRDNKKFLRLFGADERVVASNSLGAFDMESHSWRSQLIFMNNILIETGETGVDENGNAIKKSKTFMEFINAAITRHQKEGTDLNFEGAGAVDPTQEKAFYNEVGDTILAQRLYLSSLTRFSGISADIKANIWRKIAMLKPSTIMSLLPEDMRLNASMSDREWKDFRQKLYIAEMKRVQDDTHEWASISHDGHTPHAESVEQRAQEVQRFKNAVKGTDLDYKYQILTKGQFNNNEQALIRTMIDTGIAQAKKLSEANFSHTLIIDDAPFIAWTKTGFGETGRGGLASEDIVRILFSDQGAITEAWNPINEHVESPQNPNQEAFGTFVKKFGDVFGRTTAQEKLMPIIFAYLDFCKIKPASLWLGGIDRIRNNPKSEIAEYYRESHIAMDENARAIYLKGLAQTNIISDSIRDKKKDFDNMTQLDYMRKKTRADIFSLIVRWLRNFVQDIPFALTGGAKDLLTLSFKDSV